MEIILNIAWAVCSLGLIWIWSRNADSDSVPRRTQVLALAMVVLLLLPVISLSDDLMAMQGPAESDTCLRRALHSDDTHPSWAPTSFALPEQMVTALTLSGYSQEVLEEYSPATPGASLTRSLDSRPPPLA
ncbi:hypothetical protein [Acidicapsa acidisoli]|uniref:hypothetical protein n=1 Tax=Acidicapsa acidisoli TaxID=1615681 RepID=UPI0021DFA57F|nr:hypothetical protein [Acidicapsa acidisoli]